MWEITCFKFVSFSFESKSNFTVFFGWRSFPEVKWSFFHYFWDLKKQDFSSSFITHHFNHAVIDTLSFPATFFPHLTFLADSKALLSSFLCVNHCSKHYLPTHSQARWRSAGRWVVEACKDLRNASSFSVNEKQMRNLKSSKLFVEDCTVVKWRMPDLNLSSLTPESVPSAFMHKSKIPPWLNSTLYFPYLYVRSRTQMKKNDQDKCSPFKFMPWKPTPLSNSVHLLIISHLLSLQTLAASSIIFTLLLVYFPFHKKNRKPEENISWPTCMGPHLRYLIFYHGSTAMLLSKSNGLLLCTRSYPLTYSRISLSNLFSLLYHQFSYPG